MSALAVAHERLFDLAERREQPAPHGFGHVVAVALGGRHERLDPGDPQPLFRVARLTEEVPQALDRFG